MTVMCLQLDFPLCILSVFDFVSVASDQNMAK